MADDHWVGWLIDDLGDQRDDVFLHLEEAIENRNIPMYGNRNKVGSVSVKSGTTNMWWRDDTPALWITSELDGTVKAAVVIQDYATSLWVSVIMERDDRDNWAKSMAWAAFKRTLERVVKDAVTEVAGDSLITDINDPRLDPIPKK